MNTETQARLFEPFFTATRSGRHGCLVASVLAHSRATWLDALEESYGGVQAVDSLACQGNG
jgi:hypothetical protein